jgi:hypothetical protein
MLNELLIKAINESGCEYEVFTDHIQVTGDVSSFNLFKSMMEYSDLCVLEREESELFINTMYIQIVMNSVHFNTLMENESITLPRETAKPLMTELTHKGYTFECDYDSRYDLLTIDLIAKEIEIKLYSDEKNWEDVEVFQTFSVFHEKEIYDLVYDVAAYWGNEIRWNHKGSTQGHYVGTMFKFEN